MKIYFERSGGFLGRSLQARVDTAVLADEEAQALEAMLTEASFFELPERETAAAPLPGPDQMTYTVTVEAGPVEHTVCVTDMDMPEAMRTLLRHLTVLARRPDVGGQPADPA